MNSKQKGNRFERKVVKIAKEMGLEAERAWGSNGRALGLTEEVDVLIGGLPFQCKTRHKIADYILPEPSVYGQIIKEDRGEIFVVLRYKDFLNLIKEHNVKGTKGIRGSPE